MLHKLKQMMSSGSSVNCINATLTQNDKMNGIWPRLRRKIKTVLKRWEFCAWLNWYSTGSILLSTSASWMRCYDTISLSWSVSQNLCEKPLTDPHGSKLQPNEMNNVDDDDNDDDDEEDDDDASDHGSYHRMRFPFQQFLTTNCCRTVKNRAIRIFQCHDW